MEYQELSESVIGSAYRVYNKMGFGFLESVYEKCMAIELEQAGLRFHRQHPITVRYEGAIVGNYFADLFVDESILVELKSVRTLATVHEVQLVNYLVATGVDVGLFINFAEQKVEVKRKVRRL